MSSWSIRSGGTVPAALPQRQRQPRRAASALAWTCLLVSSGLVPAGGLAADPSARPATSTLRIDPRAAVTRAADAIEREYFDPARAKSVAAELRSALSSGRFDSLTDPRDLASALTARLQPVDRHFVVTWSSPTPAAGGEAVRRPRGGLPDADGLRRRNFGFRSADVLPGNVGLLQMDSFAFFGPDSPSPSARDAADASLAFLARTGALIVDLRDNGGGAPAMVGYLAGHFVPESADVFNVFEQRDAPDQSERALVPIAAERRRLDVPLYVLVSGRTGSAAESFAYTLQAAKRATIVGERTAGAANPGRFVDLGEGLQMFVSFGRPVNPITRSNWEGTGVQPDVVVPAADALLAAQELALVEQLRRVETTGESAAEEIRWALAAVRAHRTPQPSSKPDAFVGTYGPRSLRADGARLVVEHGRRPAQALLPLGGDAYTLAENPYVRFEFERGADGRVTALVTRSIGGVTSRDARSPAPR